MEHHFRNMSQAYCEQCDIHKLFYLYVRAAKVVPEEITPLIPAVVGEKVAEDQTCYILETLLKFMVIQVITPCFFLGGG